MLFFGDVVSDVSEHEFSQFAGEVCMHWSSHPKPRNLIHESSSPQTFPRNSGAEGFTQSYLFFSPHSIQETPCLAANVHRRLGVLRSQPSLHEMIKCDFMENRAEI